MKYNCVVDAWQQHEAELRGFLARQLGETALAEDALQNTFVKAIAEGSGFCSLENPRAWLFRVAKNLLIDHYRKQRDTVEIDENMGEPEEEIPALVSLSKCLPHALDRLDEEDREAITRCDLEGMKQAHFAELKGLSLPGAKSRVQRARKRLKQTLQANCNIRYDETGSICCYTPRPPAQEL